MARYVTGDGEVLDDICWRRYRRQDAVPQVLRANPGLADRDPVLPAGTVIELPDLAAPAPPVVRLWGGPAPAPRPAAPAASITATVAAAGTPAPLLAVSVEGDHQIAATATAVFGIEAGDEGQFAIRRREGTAWGAWSAPEPGAAEGGRSWSRLWAGLHARTTYEIRARQVRGLIAGAWTAPVEATTTGTAPADADALVWRGAAVDWRGAEVTWARS